MHVVRCESLKTVSPGEKWPEAKRLRARAGLNYGATEECQNVKSAAIIMTRDPRDKR